MRLSRRALLLAPAVGVVRADSPFPVGAKPTRHGAIGAREGPVWHPKIGLLFTGGGRITRRDVHDKVSTYSEDAGANGRP